MHHMLAGDNLALAIGRAGQVIDQGEWNILFCTDTITEFNLYRRGGNYLFPLYLYPESKKGDLFAEHESTERQPNLSAEFIKEFSGKLKLKFVTDGCSDLQKTFGPEDVFHYLYAVFHSPTYRERYAEFLKIDFPRVPLTSDKALFAELCESGAELVMLHLLKKPLANPPLCGLETAGDNVVEKVRYTPPDNDTVDDRVDDTVGGKVWLNATQYFEGVPSAVWEFHVGGYQVCHKWLKDRKGRTLSSDDIETYQRIVEALAGTIGLMKQIDTTIDNHGGWPIG